MPKAKIMKVERPYLDGISQFSRQVKDSTEY